MVTSEAELCVGLGNELGKVGSRVGHLGASGSLWASGTEGRDFSRGVLIGAFK